MSDKASSDTQWLASPRPVWSDMCGQLFSVTGVESLTGWSRSVRWGRSCSGRVPSGCRRTRPPPTGRTGQSAVPFGRHQERHRDNRWKTRGTQKMKHKEDSRKKTRGTQKKKHKEDFLTFFLHFLMASSDARSVVENAKTQAWAEKYSLRSHFFYKYNYAV